MLTIMLHRVLPKIEAHDYYSRRGTAISQCKFIELLAEAKKRKFMVGTSNAGNNQPMLRITFDDGYSDNSWAFDYLLERNMTAWLFPVKDYIQQRFSVVDDLAAQVTHSPSLSDVISNQRIRHICRRVTSSRYRYLRHHFFGIEEDRCDEALFLTEQQIAHYAKCGIKLGVHGTTHRVWSHLSEQSLEQELISASNWLKLLSNDSVEAACFPHGKEPNDSMSMNLLNSYKCFGVDREYDNQKIVRRLWLKEDTDVEKVFDEYKYSF